MYLSPKLSFCLLLILMVIVTGCSDEEIIDPPGILDSDTIVGDLDEPPVIEITNALEGLISGQANNLDTEIHRVVVWAKTDRWYVQPLATQPFTLIDSTGNWSSTTNPWVRITALLVGPDYQPDPVTDLHPATDPRVLAWDEHPAASLRMINFSGWNWHVKSAELAQAGPGPNYFSNDESAVWVDVEGLHLATTQQDGKWYSAEVILAQTTGYGVYAFELGSRVDTLDYKTVFAGFIYDTVNQEIDFEFSRSLVGPDHNAQYVTQPWDFPGNIYRYTMPPVEVSSHLVEWRHNFITWTSWRGGIHDEHPDSLITTWTYDGPWIPTPDNERFRFNLWFIYGDDPESSQPDEVLIRSFSYQP